MKKKNFNDSKKSMKPTKTVYVKDYKRNLDDVKSEETNGYLEYPIYKLPMELLSFTESEVGKWHPDIKLQNLKYDGSIFFAIGSLAFKVRERGREDSVVTISTNFQEMDFENGKMVNNLNLFKKFQKSFVLQDFVDTVDEFTGVDTNGVQFVVDAVYYNKTKDWLQFKIKSDEFSEFLMNFEKVRTGYRYIGVGFCDLEVWYSQNDNLDLDNRIGNLIRKRQLVQYIKFKLYDIFGIGHGKE